MPRDATVPTSSSPTAAADPLAGSTTHYRGSTRQTCGAVASCATVIKPAQCTIASRRLINFGSNDYLGLASDPRLVASVAAAVQREGWGAGASPLVTGYANAQRQLETRLAEFEGAEAALVVHLRLHGRVGSDPRPGGTGRRDLR